MPVESLDIVWFEPEIVAMEAVEHQQVYLGADSRRMDFLDSESVHLIVTSPPYWQLKDYGDSQQIGFHDSYETYINDMNLVWSECARVIKPGCRVAINIGDQFARAECYGRYKVIPIRTEIVRAMESLGLDHMGSIIWRKVTTCNSSGGASVMGSFPTPRNGVVKLDYEFILLFKKPGKTAPPSKEAKEASRLTTEEWNQYFAGHWEFPGEKQIGHIAMFPEELPRRLIRMFSFPGEVVLDPFLGSGTTMLAAANLDRKCLGIELNHEFGGLIRERLSIFPLFDDGAVRFHHIGVEERPSREQIIEMQKQLPYIFHDPVVIERKGAGKKKKRDPGVIAEAVCGVTDVVSGQEVLLADGRQVILRGIKLAAQQEELAYEFLKKRLKGARVFTRHAVSVGEKTHAYLHLKNRTNMNAHLIKAGLATCDLKDEHPMKARFLRYENDVS